MGSVTRPRLLFLCHTLPYPPDGGVWIRTYHVLRLLAEAFDITALCFERAATAGTLQRAGTDEAQRALSRFAKVEIFPIPQKHSRVRYLWDHLRSTAFGRVYTTYVYESEAFRRRLTELIEVQPFDLIHVDNLDLASYLPSCGSNVVCVHHNVESTLLGRRAAIERTTWRHAYIRYQAALMEDVERRWCQRVRLNVAVSEQDRELLERLAPTARVTVIPNGVDVTEFTPDDHATGSGVAFVGGANWFPNLDALEFFAGEIWPLVKDQQPGIAARWVGAASPAQRQHFLDQHGIDLTGYVDDVRSYMRKAACHIVPLRAGGGTRLKILNSWAMGKPVVSTSVGCEGLAAVDGDNILIRDDPKEFAQAIVAVMKDPGLRTRLGRRGRQTAETRYSWDVIGQELIATYLALANHSGQLDSEIATSADVRYRRH